MYVLFHVTLSFIEYIVLCVALLWPKLYLTYTLAEEYTPMLDDDYKGVYKLS